MIKPITPESQNKYRDPLNSNYALLMSCSNEFGTAISEIAPKLGTALWAPAFLYLGADIYDKYKNDKENYNPSTQRALKRAIYQGISSIIAMPAIVYLGQSLVSPLGKLDKTGISGNTKDAIYKHTQAVIEQVHGSDLESFESFNGIIKQTLGNKLEALRNEKETSNPIKSFFKRLFTHRYDLLKCDKNKIFAFAEENTRKTFEIMLALKAGDKNKIPPKILKKYNKILPAMKEMYRNGDYSYQATRYALKEYQNSRIFKNKLLKTCGGFIALFSCAKFVNEFVDKNIMTKYVNPGIEHISTNITAAPKLQDLINSKHHNHG